LLGFKLAGSKNRADFIPKPIKVVSFASPRVGDDVFNEAFEVRLVMETPTALRLGAVCSSFAILCLPVA
jgi:hypothetical protein